MKNLCLRSAESGDWHFIASLLSENALPREGARAHLADFVVAMSDDWIVGCAGAEVYGEVALLRSVAVAPRWHGKGIGTMLVRRLLEDAKKRKIAKLYLRTVDAQHYFARFGFQAEPIGELPDILQASAEFQGACPSSATVLSLPLTAAPA